MVASTEVGTDGATTAVDYAALIRRQWLVILVGVLVGALAGVGYLTQRPAAFTSSTTVLVRSTPGLEAADTVGARTTGAINLDTEAQIARSATVAEQARASLGAGEPAGSLTSRLSVRVPPNSEVLVFDFTDRNPDLAATGSLAFAEAYLANRGAAAAASLDARRAGLDGQLLELRGQLDVAVTQLAAAEVGSREESLATAERNGVERQIAELEAQRASLELTVPTPGEVITPPAPGQPDTRTRVLVAFVSGPFAGLLLGLGVALVRDRTTRRLHPDDLERLSRLPVLARVPGPLLEDSSRPLPPAQESALFRLRNALLHIATPAPVTVLVAGAGQSGSSAQLARSLAQVLARGEGPVALVEVIGGVIMVHESVRTSATRNQQGSTEVILSRLRRVRRHVVVSVPGMADSQDAQSLASDVDAVLLVVDEGMTNRPHLRDAVQQLTAVNARVAGLVLVERARGRKQTSSPETTPATAVAPSVTASPAGGIPPIAEGKPPEVTPPAPSSSRPPSSRPLVAGIRARQHISSNKDEGLSLSSSAIRR